jgi:hypothetical protein
MKQTFWKNTATAPALCRRHEMPTKEKLIEDFKKVR